MNAKVIFTGAFIVFLGNSLSSVVGLLREMLTAAYFGANVEMDSYIFATTIPFIFLAFVEGFLKAGFIPSYIKNRVNGSNEEASLLFSNTINVLLLLFVLVMALCYGFTHQIAVFFSPSEAVDVLIKNLLWILLPSIFFLGLSYMLSAILNSINKFAVPAFVPVINNIIVILLIISLHQIVGIYSVAIGFLAGAFLQITLLLPALKKSHIRYTPQIDFRDKELRKVLLTSIPIIALVLIEQCVFLATRYFSSSLDPGSASALNYASRIISLPITLFGTALITAAYPSAIVLHAERQYEKYDLIVKTGLKSILLIFMPIAFISVIYAPNIIRILFERGAFNSLATHMTATCLIYLSIGMIVSPIKEFIVKLFFSKSLIKIPLISSLFYLITFFISCLVLVPYLKYIGIAIASSLALLVSLLYLIVKYNALDPRRKIGINVRYILKVVFASSISAFLPYLIYWSCMQFGGLQKIWIVLTVGCIGFSLLLYLTTVKMLKIKEIEFVFTAMASKFNFMKKRGAVG
jgi:putative peptidoglycan lipid II flippase